MSSFSGETSHEDFVEENEEEVDVFTPRTTIKCPSNPVKKTRVNYPKSISHLFLLFSIKKLTKGYELSLKGEHVFKNIGRRIEDTDLPTILAYLAEAEEEILSLDLSHNWITEEGFDMLCEFLLHSRLINLNLRNNEIRNLREKGCKILENVTCLKRLTLSGNHLSKQTADNMVPMLKANKTLEVLELEGVDFYVHCVSRIADVLIGYNNTLKVLNVSRVLGIPRYRLRSYYLAEIVHSLLVANSALVELHLEKNGITDPDLETIVSALKLNRTLTVLNLTANIISNIGVEKIAMILPESNLQVLLLRSNTIGNYGAIALSKAMPLSRIAHLDLAHNRIDDIGLANLLWTIKKSTPLYTFYIFGNYFTKQTLEIIHVQMLRGKIMPNSLDILLYWEEDGSIRCSYNPDADEYRNQMAGLYDGAHVAANQNILSYPVIDVLCPYQTLKHKVEYPKAYNPKVLSNYKDHIAVK